MKSPLVLGCVVVLLLGGLAGTVWAGEPPTISQATAQLKAEAPQAVVLHDGVKVSRVGGQPLAYGATPVESAEQFRLRHAAVFGAVADDLAPVSRLPDGRQTQPLMFDPQTGEYKFTLVCYSQFRDGIPVFRSDLQLLVRNEPGYPLVLAASSLCDLGDFSVDPILANMTFEPVSQTATGMTRFTKPVKVIWAGLDEQPSKPMLAVTFIGDNERTDAGFEKWRFVCDEATGKIVYQETMIHFTDVSGNVQAMATPGAKADICTPSTLHTYPWAKVDISGGSSVYADGVGNFTIPNAGTSAVTVRSYVDGLYFTIQNAAGSVETLNASVTPPGPANFIHNQADTSDLVRAQTNIYTAGNACRDWLLSYNPSFPGVATETGVLTVVNRTDYYCPCNAWSDSSDGSINFCQAGSGCPNTAWQSVLNHEYGHHCIDFTSSGQGAYGEGMADCFSMLPVDDPNLGYGFLGDCSSGLRTADNDCQYLASGCSTCGSEIHDCGMLLSGIVWSIRNNLVATEPVNYLSILSNIVVNSILVHTGTSINQQIAIDFLTLDDNDGNINNGTPHRTEICAGFSAHGIQCPALLTGLSVSPTSGFDSSGPVGGPFTPVSTSYTLQNLGSTGSINYAVTKTQPWITLTNATGTLTAGGTATVTVSINASANSLSAGTYTDVVTFTNTTDHAGDTSRAVSLVVGGRSLQYEWNMDTNPGWTTQGQWAWGHPTGGGGQYGNPDPTNGYTGSNVYGYNLAGDYANSIPEYHLTSTAINCSDLTGVTLRFWRWLGVEQPSYDHAYVRVSNNGSTWTTIWQNTAQVADSSWLQQEFDISAVADNQPTVYLRWTMGTTDSSWQFCGWNLDDIQIWAYGVPTQQYTLTVNTTGQGTVALDPAGPNYPPDTTVTLTANAAAGWHFDHWTGALTGSTNPATLLMDADKSVTAVFVQNTYTLTVNVTGQGTVGLNPAGPTYPSGTTVTLTPSATTGWRFDHWEGALTGSTNPATLVMDGDKTVTAVFVEAPGGPIILMTFTSATTVPGVGSVANEDIVAYDVGLNTWSMYFDGSDVGLSSFTVDALARLPSGELLISTSAGGSISGLTGGPSGTTITSSDIIKFTPTSLGATTTGTWSFYFDGSDVSLTSSSENIDALAVTADGKLLISTTGDPSVTGLSGLTDDDLIQFTPTSLGSVTAGTWAHYFDGSDVGLTTTNEDVDAVARTSAGKLLLSTFGNFSVTGVSGADEDVLQFTPTSLGSTTAGTYLMYLDLSTKSISTSANVNALEIIE